MKFDFECSKFLYFNSIFVKLVIGYGLDKKTAISNMQVFKMDVSEAMAGDNVGINLRNIQAASLKKGMMLVKVDSFVSTNHFEGATYFLTKVNMIR